MKRIMFMTALLLALASPAMAQTTTYPPPPPTTVPPPVCVNPPCDTADTGSDVGGYVAAGVILLVLGAGTLLVIRRRS